MILPAMVFLAWQSDPEGANEVYQLTKSFRRNAPTVRAWASFCEGLSLRSSAMQKDTGTRLVCRLHRTVFTDVKLGKSPNRGG